MRSEAVFNHIFKILGRTRGSWVEQNIGAAWLATWNYVYGIIEKLSTLAFVFVFQLISSLFTLLIEGQKLALITLFSTKDSFNCWRHKNGGKGIFAANYFQLDKVENLLVSHCEVYHERTKGRKWMLHKRDKAYQNSALCSLFYLLFLVDISVIVIVLGSSEQEGALPTREMPWIIG